jgi:hypothetical protein
MEVVLRAAWDGDAPAVAETIISSRATFIPYAPMAHGQCRRTSLL